MVVDAPSSYIAHQPAEAAAPKAALMAATMPAPNAEAIFLHAGWRSCGTWLWEQLRERPSVQAYYEPLHEGLARLDGAAIGAFRPDSWGSGHGAGAPYFAEYGPLLNRHGSGVAGYRQRFAFDDFFRAPDDEDDDLRAYLARLIDSAHSQGRLPVLKFCRSLGRVAWLRQRFPAALQVVVLRDPVAQWHSARRQMERDANRYFVLAPFVILARNRHNPLLAAALRHLEVPMPPRLAGSLDTTVTICWRHVKLLGWADRYRGFLALWAATAVAALSAGVAVIDADLLGHDPAHRHAAEAMLGQATGLPLLLAPAVPSAAALPWPGTDAEAADAARAALAALAFVADHRALIGAAQTRMLSRKLAPRFAARPPCLTHAGLPPLPRPAGAPEALRLVDAVIYLALARAAHPLRRAHFHVRQWVAGGDA